MERTGRSKRRWIIGGLILFQLLVVAAMVVSVRGAFTADGVRLGRITFGDFSPLDWLSSVGPIRRSEEFQETIRLDSRADIQVVNSMGEVTVIGDGPAGQIELVGKKSARGFTDEQVESKLRRTKIEVKRQGSRLVIRRAKDVTPFRTPVGVDITLHVPQDADITVNADMGEIEIRQIRGNLDLDADMGRITVDDTEGNLKASADMGDIQIRGAKVTDSLELVTDMGSVDFEGRPGRRSVVSSDMGSIRMALPTDQAFTVDASVDMGDINMEVPFVGKQGNGKANGTIGEGEVVGNLQLSADMGSVRIVAQQ